MAIKHLSPRSPKEIREFKLDYLARIAQSILDNGFFTVAYNWRHTAHKNWIFLFKQLGVKDDSFYSNLEDLFCSKDDYEYFNRPEVDDEGDGHEEAWEDMSRYAGRLQKYLTPGLTKKLKDVANKNYNFIFK